MAGFCTDTLEMKSFDKGLAGGDVEQWRDASGRQYRACANRKDHGSCNWMITVSADDQGRDTTPTFCRACSMNEMIPDLSLPGNLPLWRSLEVAKRRCLFSLMELDLPLSGPGMSSMRYRFLADTPANLPVLTGHDNGLITINLAEADDIERTRLRVELDEPYRTLLGHFRHECGHYYWDVFNQSQATFAPRFREVFGDERRDYSEALAQHYDNASAAGTGRKEHQRTHVSDYATMHPWEDWAESWAHYLHIIDAIETQQSLSTHTNVISAAVREVALPLSSGKGTRHRAMADFEAIFALWMQASVVLNSLNRSMGLADPYPFVLHPPIKRKLRFIHDTVVNWHDDHACSS